MSRLLVTIAFLLAGSVAPAAAQDVHQDPKLGFKIRPPQDFTKVPLKPDEEWIAARWISDKAFYQTDKTDGWTRDDKPEMYVIAFAKKLATTEDEKGGDATKPVDASKPIVITVDLKTRYKDYRDYLKRTYNEGGFYIAAEDKADVEGVQVETLDIKVERGVMGGPKKIVTWIFKGADVDIAVQFEMWETAWTKLKPDILSCFRSFRRIAKEATKPSAEGTGSVVSESQKEKNLDELNPAQRAARRRDQEKQNEEKLAKNLPDGWTVKHFGRVFAISHLDDKATHKFCDDASAVLDFMDANLGFIGPGEYVRAPVVRLCKDYDEYRMYQKGSGWTWGDEIVSYRDTGYISSFSFNGSVTERCAQHWLRERNDDLYYAMPWWLRSGLDSAFGKTKIKNGKLEFYNDSWERVDVAQQIRDGKISSLKDLMNLSNTDLGSDSNRWSECAAAVRFFLTGPKKGKEAFRAYLDALGPIVKKRAEDRKKALESAAPTAKAKTEEEEDAQFKAAREKSRDESKGLLEDTFKRAFGAMSESDWKAIELAYQKSLG